jgi:metallophosphoesterase superfamily enzyme
MSINQKETQNILIIGDIHEPFSLEGYREHCVEMYKKFNCNKVIFIGDIIDNHYSSYHETDTEAMGGGAELQVAIDKVALWYELFPEADVCIGNHDALISRKAQSGGIPEQWIKSYSEVLGTPGWRFETDFIYDNVRYTHGHKSSKARTASKRDMMSTVTGHYHTDFYCEYNFGIAHKIFALAVGSGVDDNCYAVKYAAGGKKSAVGCAVVLDDGTLPILCPMDLEKYRHMKKPQPTQKIKEKELPTQDTQEGRGRKSKRILDESTGEIYIKQKDVQDLLGVSKGYLSSMLNGRLNNKTTFKYIN